MKSTALYRRTFFLLSFCGCLLLLLAPPSPAYSQTPEPTITPTPEPLPDLVWVCGDDGWIPPLGCPLIDPDAVQNLTYAYLNTCSDCVPPSSDCRWEWTHDFPSRPTPEPAPPPEGCGDALAYLPVLPAPGVPCAPARVGTAYHSCGYYQDGDEGEGVIARLDLIIPFSRSDLRSITNFDLQYTGGDADIKIVFHWCTGGINDDTACTRKTTVSPDEAFDMTFEYVYQIDIAFTPQFVTTMNDADDWWIVEAINFCSSGLVFPNISCGQSLPIHDWESLTNRCLSIKNPDDSWSSCVYTIGGNRRAELNASYVWDEGEPRLSRIKTIDDLVFNISPVPDFYQITFRRCGISEASCTLSSNRITYTSDDYPNLMITPLTVDRVWAIDIVAESEPCSSSVCSPEDMVTYTLTNVSFCSSGDPMFPPATPIPPAPPEPDPPREPCGIPNLTSDWWNGSNDPDCQFTNDWDVLIDPALNSTIEPMEGENCTGAYISLGYNDPPAPLGFYPTYRYIRQVQADFLCTSGLYYRVRVRANDGLSAPSYYSCPNIASSQWIRHTLDFGEMDTLDAEFQPYLLIASNYLTEPAFPLLPAVDNILVFSADRRRCDLSEVADCSIPENVSELPLAFSTSFTIEYSSFDCYRIFPALNLDLTWINQDLRIVVPDIDFCVFWFELPEFHLFGVQISFFNLLNMVVIFYAYSTIRDTFNN